MPEKIRCPWCLKFDQYIRYHDEEWGVPVHDDHKHFEFLILEGAQAGLSWSTILKKREGYQKNFAGFDPQKVARFTQKKIDKILTDPGIIRNKLKVHAAVNNAKRFLEVQKEFGSFDQYIWEFVNGKPIVKFGISKDVIYIIFPQSRFTPLTPDTVVEKTRQTGKQLLINLGGNPT